MLAHVEMMLSVWDLHRPRRSNPHQGVQDAQEGRWQDPVLDADGGEEGAVAQAGIGAQAPEGR